MFKLLISKLCFILVADTLSKTYIMKLFYLAIATTLMSLSLGITSAQESKNALEYRRSSLTMVLAEDDGLGKSKDMVIKSYESYPFPDKYNLHQINDKKFDPASMKLTVEDYRSAGFYNDTLRTFKDFMLALKKPFNAVRYVAADSSAAVLEPSDKELLQIYLGKYIKEKGLAKQIAATWFNRKADGSMDWSVIQERGKYSASAEKSDQAESAALQVDYLMDWDLLTNTYTIFHKMEFYENEPVARLIRDIAKVEAMKKLAGKPEILITKTMEGIDKIYETTKEGYTVKCNAFLYQLDWNEEVATKAKKYLFSNTVDSKTAWDTADIFKMIFVGKITSASIVTFKIGEKRTEAQIIDLQIKRTMDNALAKLQKEYVQFRPVSPISSIEPLTARIGMKEGVEPGQKFEILEVEFNNLGMPVYVQKEKITVDKKTPVWDNRQGSDQEQVTDESGASVKAPEFTTFKGGKKAQPGLSYIRLIK